MASAYHASVISARCRRGDWTFHCVSSDASCHANRCSFLYIDLSDYVRSPLHLNSDVKPTSKSTIQASGGLSVIGGNTTNFVGLGGCLPESK
jgi:hypothetical protein